MNDEQKDQQLDAAYRRASAGEAGRPDAKTRAAILAEAAAAARRRAPAANELRYLLRAVAGIAVIGVGVLVWRQTDHRLPGEAPSLTVSVSQQSMEVERDSGFVPDPEAEARRSAPGVASPPPPPPAPSPSPVPPPPTALADEPAPMLDTEDQDEMQEVQVTGARMQRPRRTVGPRDTVPAPTAGASRTSEEAAAKSEPTAENLLRGHFPAQYESATPRRVWLVLDAGGAVRGTGELEPGEQVAQQMASIRQQLDTRELAVESVQSIPNARGQLVELTVLRTR